MKKTKMPWCRATLTPQDDLLNYQQAIAAISNEEEILLLLKRADGRWGWYALASGEWYQMSGEKGPSAWETAEYAIKRAQHEEWFANICNVDITLHALTRI